MSKLYRHDQRIRHELAARDARERHHISKAMAAHERDLTGPNSYEEYLDYTYTNNRREAQTTKPNEPRKQ